jgi:hypothetical protein
MVTYSRNLVPQNYVEMYQFRSVPSSSRDLTVSITAACLKIGIHTHKTALRKICLCTLANFLLLIIEIHDFQLLSLVSSHRNTNPHGENIHSLQLTIRHHRRIILGFSYPRETLKNPEPATRSCDIPHELLYQSIPPLTSR